jgi:hypothetical protein
MMKLSVHGGLAPRNHGEGICSRCLFQNECLRIRLIGLCGSKDLAGCFAGCRGVLTVSFGEVQVEVGGASRTLQEGDSLPLPARADSFHLWAKERADVVFFESLGKDKAN